MTMLTNAGLLLLGVATGATAARVLGPEQRGELAAIQNLSLILSAICALGFPEAIVYFGGRETPSTRTLVGTAVAAVFGASLVAIGLGYALAPVVLRSQSVSTITEARVYLLLLPASAVALPFFLLQAQGRFPMWNLLRLGAPLLWLGVLLIAHLQGRATTQAVARSNLAALIVFSLASGAWIIARYGSGALRLDLGWLVRLARYGFPAALTSAPQLLSSRLDQLVIAAALPPRALGLYAVAVAWGASAGPLLGAVGSVVFPKMASTIDPTLARGTFAFTTRLATLLALSLAAALLALTPLGVHVLFGAAYDDAAPVAELLVVAGGLQGLSRVFEGGLQGLGAPGVPALAENLAMVLSVCGLALLVPPFGVVGAALAGVVASAGCLTLLCHRASRLTLVPVSDLLVPRSGDVGYVLRRMLERVP